MNFAKRATYIAILNLAKHYGTYGWKVFSNLFNAVLVAEGVRPAALTSRVDYKNNEDILDDLVELYTELNLKTVEFAQGLLIMKQDTYLTFNTKSYTETELGEFLGYPYAGDIFKARNYGYEIRIKVEMLKCLDVQIIGMIAGTDGNEQSKKLEDAIRQFMLQLNFQTDNNITVNYIKI